MRAEPSEIVIRGGDYEHVTGIAGSHDGLRFGYEVMRIHDIFARMIASRPFEVCEFPLASYLTLRATGQDWLTAIPVFPYRAFRHSLAVTHCESGLTSLGQLAGKRIGVEDYSMTAAVWFRALLGEEYGIDHRSITWVTGPKQRFAFPAGATVETSEADLEQLLCERAIDAMLAISPRDARLPPAQRRLRPVLLDTQAEEQAYYERTGLYPIHHCVVIRNDVIERRPELVDIVYNAYEAVKARAYQRKLGTTLVPWGGAYWARTFERFGGDPLPYGWTSTNRLVVDRLARHLHEQGFIAAVPDGDRLFARPSAAATSPNSSAR
jgi:4,5-dihydroxyphthalate decarboxylase